MPARRPVAARANDARVFKDVLPFVTATTNVNQIEAIVPARALLFTWMQALEPKERELGQAVQHLSMLSPARPGPR